ncbi:MAG: nucleotide sugar dehydrogenase [Candidatus Tyrphobacter sp.]
MKITVAGLGYIGLPTAAMLAESGHEVLGYDTDKKVIAGLAAGRVELAERGVRDLVRRALESGRLHPSLMPFPADAFVICVPTPTVDHRPDLRAVEAAFGTIVPLVRDGNLIMLESTVPPGTTLAVAERTFRALGRDLDAIHLAHCPERVLPGKIVDELLWNDRIVGGRRPVDAEMARAVYATFARGEIHVTDLTTAETVKIVENAYRDVNIAFANELAILAEALGIDAWETIRLANCHPRVDILSPGPGVGGHCIPVDPQFLANANPFASELIQTARRVNERMPHVVTRIVRRVAPIETADHKIALLGAAYKPDIDDARETPTLAIEHLLADAGYTVSVYDPIVTQYPGTVIADFEAAARDADVLVIVTDHSQIRELDPQAVAAVVRSRILVDCRNAVDVDRWNAAGFDVHVIGRGTFRSTALVAAA